MKKFLSLVVAAALMFSLTACGGGSDDGNGDASGSGEAATATTDGNGGSEPANTNENNSADEYKVALLLPGSVNDQGWNGTAHEGLLALGEKYGLETQFSENVGSSDAEDYIRNYINGGFNVIFAHGTQFTDACKKLGPEYPDVSFIISTSADDFQEPNVACMSFKAGETGFMAGVIAGAITESNVVAFLGGEESPSISPAVDYFAEGAKYVNPDVEALTGYIGSLTDVNMAKEMALTYQRRGADVFSASANSAGMGVIQAAEETDSWAIGYNSDQNDVAPDTVVVSVQRNAGMAMDDIYGRIVDGTFEPVLYAYGVKDGAVYLSDWFSLTDQLPADTFEKIEQVIQDFKDDKIYCGEL